MRVMQLIDSLDAGGAERVAVTFANSLCDEVEASFLCATRKEGVLRQTIDDEVEYLFLKKRHTFDIGAMIRLRMFLKKNRIDIIHAHSSSYFLASLITAFRPKVSLIWHDHFGNSEELQIRKFKMLKWCSNRFCAILSVNRILEKWAKLNLRTNKVYYLENAVSDHNKDIVTSTDLEGEKGKRVICLANLRPQKDHENLIKAFKIVNNSYPDHTLHLVGQNWNDYYYHRIIDLIDYLDMNENIYYYGSQSNIYGILNNCDIGVLSSHSEGLPLALLEYGMAHLPVVCTNVGQCKEVIDGYGLCVEPGQPEMLANSIIYYIEHHNEMLKDALSFREHVKENYSVKTIIPKLMSYYDDCR